jgi:hypothetical protein
MNYPRSTAALSAPATGPGISLPAAHLLITAAIAAINMSPLRESWTVEWLFAMNLENNVVVWFTSASLLLIAALATDIGERDKAAKRTGWRLVAALFLLLSLDEVASLHELAGLLFSARVATIDALPDLYAWVVVVAPFAAIGALMLGRWMLRATAGDVRARRLSMGALGAWLLVPFAEALDPLLGQPYALIVFEESLELIGIAAMLGAFLAVREGLLQTASDARSVAA